MRISMWYNNRDIRIAEVPTPSPGPREMLLKVRACGICGSDIVEWYRLPRAPLVQGHEVGAEVVKMGDAVTRFRPGDRVVVAPKVPCLQCHYCSNGHFPQCSEVKERLPGGFAEYILVPEILMENGTLLLPDNVSYDQATFVEPLACVVRSQHLADLRARQTVLVLGCGMSGLLQIKLAKAKEARVVATDINPNRLTVAAKVGADLTLNANDDIPGKLASETGRLADVVMLCTAAMPALEQAWRSVDKGGVIVFFTVPGPDKSVNIPINDFWTREVTIRTAYYCGPEDLKESLRLIASGEIGVDDMITHSLPLDEIARGFRLVCEGTESIKVIIKP